MGIYDDIKELEAEEAKESGAVNGDEDTNIKDNPDDVKSDSEESEAENEGEDSDKGNAEAEGVGEQDKKDVVDEPKNVEQADSSAFARMRIQNKELRDRLDAIEKQKQDEAEERKRTIEAESDPEPNKEEKYEAWLEWNNRQLKRENEKISKDVEDIKKWRSSKEKEEEEKIVITSALEELGEKEAAFKRKQPDYDAAVNHGRAILKTALAVTNPTKSDKQLNREVSLKILDFASAAARNGVDPAEALYDYSVKKLGYTKQEAAKEDAKKEQRPSLKKIEANKAKSASSLNAGGGGGRSAVTLEAIDEMSMAEFSRLSESELNELERAAQGA